MDSNCRKAITWRNLFLSVFFEVTKHAESGKLREIYENCHSPQENFEAALERAAKRGDPNEIAQLIHRGREEKLQVDLWKILNRALRRENSEVVDLLLEEGFELDAALSRAVRLGCSLPFLRSLLERGADPNWENAEAMRFAVCNNNIGALRILLEFGGRPTDCMLRSSAEIGLHDVFQLLMDFQ